MQTRDPLQARQWFKLRAPINWALSIVIFIPLVFVLQTLFSFLIADIIAIALIFCFFFFYLHKRAIAIECPHCGKYIETNTPWVCAVCGTKNLRVDDFPFVNRCENPACGYEPKAYQCHHLDCGELIFLSPDKSGLNFAKCINMPERQRPVKKRKERNEAAELQEGIQLGKLRVEKARIDVELKGLKTELEPRRMKTLEDKYRLIVKDEDDARKLKAAIDVECKDDPDERAKRHAIVDALLRDTL